MPKKKKKSRKKLIVFGGLGILLVFLIAMVIVQGGKEEVLTVQTEEAKIRNITETVTAIGTIQSEFKVLITPEVTGEIVELPVEDGDHVKKGQLLLKIKSDKYIAARDRALANLQSALATLDMRKAELERIQKEYNRIKEMHAKDLASDQQLEMAESNFLSAEAMFNSAKASVAQSRAALAETTEELLKTSIKSPMSGTVTQLNVELGERVLGSGFSQGTNTMTVSDLENMEAIVEVDENDIVRVAEGDTARVKVDAFGDRLFTGIVYQIGNSAITTGRGTQEQVVNFEVRIKLIDTGAELRPGMSCNVEIETETRVNVVSVPIQSVTARIGSKDEDESEEQNEGDDKFQEIVFTVENGKAVRYDVETGISDDNYIEIVSGIKEDKSVISGPYRAISRELEDGKLVTVDKKKGSRFSSGDE